MLSFSAVAAREPLVTPPRPPGNLLPLRVLPLEGVAASPRQLDGLMKRHRRDGYMLAACPARELPLHEAVVDSLWSRWGRQRGDGGRWCQARGAVVARGGAR